MIDWTENCTRLLGLELTTQQIDAFALYERELLDWNSRFNLTAIRDTEGIRNKHFIDSLSCLLAIQSYDDPESLIYIGTGAGFPGIPLKIIFPQMRLTLVESIGKKAHFCEHIAELLAFSDTRVFAIRSEELAHQSEHREQYELATARAVASTPVLVEYLLPFLRLGGRAILQKGESAREEAEQSSKALRVLGGELHDIQSIQIPGVEIPRYLVSIDKIAPSPAQFPRRTGLPAKEPILP